MGIRILTATEKPMDVISIAAGTSYGKDDPKRNRVVSCFDRGHMSVFEHASVTFRVDGISRACSHQLVRHRMASFVQVSQRYTKIDTEYDWFVMPPSFAGDVGKRAWFESCMDCYAEDYKRAIIECGIKPEDARYLLPEACKTELTVTMNVRELFHFLNLRTDQHAQWEIRDMANELWQEIAQIDDQWGELMGLWSAGGCNE